MAATERLLARATLWAWLGQAFAYPTAEVRRRLTDPAAWGPVERAAATAGPKRDDPLCAAVERARAALDGWSGGSVDLAEEHTFLFGRHVRVPPYETSYTIPPGADRSPVLAELGGFCAAFGLQPRPDRPDAPDHVGAECELLAVLLAKEAYAAAQGWRARAKIARDARQKLVSEHLGRWLPAFRARLAKHHRLPAYLALADVGLALLGYEAPAAEPLPPEAADAAGWRFTGDAAPGPPVPLGCQAPDEDVAVVRGAQPSVGRSAP